MPGRIGSPTPTMLGELRQQTVDERAVGVAGARMDDEARRLVDDDHVVVDVDDAELDDRVGGRQTRRSGSIDGSTSTCWPSARRTLPDRRDDDRRPGTAGGDQRRRRRPADVGDQRHDPVEPLPVERGGHDSSIMIDASGRRSVGDRVRRGGVAARALGATDEDAVQDQRRIAPTLTAMSATLKIGNHWKSMKSTTRPAQPARRRGTVDRCMLPAAPPMMQPDAELARARLAGAQRQPAPRR